MRWVTKILFASLISIGIAFGLSILPEWGMTALQENREVPVFKQNRTVSLSDQNLVDFFAILPLELSIRRVDWSNSILTLDLEVTQMDQTRETIFRDLFEIVQAGFLRTNNVKQVLIRVMNEKESGDQGQLLLAMDASKLKLSNEKEAWRKYSTDPELFLNTHFQFTYTPKWKRQYEP